MLYGDCNQCLGNGNDKGSDPKIRGTIPGSGQSSEFGVMEESVAREKEGAPGSAGWSAACQSILFLHYAPKMKFGSCANFTSCSCLSPSHLWDSADHTWQTWPVTTKDRN